MKFDSGLAWKQASSAISANREVLFVLAGVFYLLPGLAVALLFPQPEMPADPTPKEAMAILSEYYESVLPVLIPMLLFQATGTLALLTMLTDKSRPTVGEAIKRGVKGIIPYILAQIVFAFAMGFVGGLVIAVGAVTGQPVVAALGMAAAIALFVYGAIKTSLVAPVIVVEGQVNPIAALMRSWNLAKGNSFRLLLFYFVVAAAFLVIMMVVTAIGGIAVNLLLGEEIGGTVMLAVSAALNAVMALYFSAIIVAVHRQLAGPSQRDVAQTFD